MYKRQVPGDAGHLTTVGFVATLPALGYEVFHLAPAAADATGASQDAEGIRLSGGCDAQIRASTGQYSCLLYTSPSPRDRTSSRLPSSA
mgnify:CR=1 FL=1